MNLTVWHHGQPIAVGQSQSFVVVEDRIQILDPHGVHGAVEDQPNVLRLLDLSKAKKL